MKQTEAIKIYELFDEFIERCIVQGDSLITDGKDVFTSQAIQEVIENFVKNQIKGGQSFDEKVALQLDPNKVSYEARLVMSHAIWLWCMAPNDFRVESKRWASISLIEKDEKENINEDAFFNGGFGSAGPYLKYNKPNEIIFNILLFRLLKKKVAEGIKDVSKLNAWAEHFAIKGQFREDDHPDFPFDEKDFEDLPEGKLVMYNIIPHLANPDNYERIASENHKNALFNAFSGLIEGAEEEIKEANREVKIRYIRKRITELTDKTGFDFYSPDFSKIWYNTVGESNFDHLQALMYKKAIVFYGPPGTSKTYSAKALARTLVYQHYFKKPENVNEYFENEIDITSQRIHRLQLHPNYSYEDFIAGIRIVDGDTKPEKGDLLKLIEEIKDDDFPHVLILDEINRVDVSRMFGELFSAIEDRDDEIGVSIGGFKIKVPKNLYIIGTMNEIDFSLERLDFALRRRFVWAFMGFDAGALESIIDSKDKSWKLKAEDKERFVRNAEKLNKAISGHPELGEMYQIGHTFFAEVVDIYLSFMEINNRSRQFNLFMKDGPAEVLWDISLKPMLEAFFGNLDTEEKKKNIKPLRELYMAK